MPRLHAHLTPVGGYVETPVHRGFKGVLGLAGWLAVTFAAAAVGGIASARAPEFYASLDKPGWAPPASLFGPVWSVLYLLIAVAAWLVWRERGFGGATTALLLYLVQLVLNMGWTWIFFAWRQGGIALGEIVALWIVVALTMMAFFRVRPLAGALMVPYLAWITYAAALTTAVWQRNPNLL